MPPKTIPIPQGATIGDPQPQAVPIPQGATIGQQPTQSAPQEEPSWWDKVNTGLISGKSILNTVSAPGMKLAGLIHSGNPDAPQPGESATDYMARAGRVTPNDSPAMAAYKTGVAGVTRDTADTASSFTSPVALATMGAGALAKAPAALGTLGKALSTLAGLGFAGMGANQVVNSFPNISYEGITQRPETLGLGANPQDLQNALMGGAMIAGGAAGTTELARQAKGKVGNMGRGVLAGKMAETPAGENFSRGEVNNAAREHGVNLDVADATDSKVARTIKRANQYSLTGGGSYEAAQQKNLASLEKWADGTLNKLSPEPSSREALGGQVQSALEQDLAFRKEAARKAFSELDEKIGGRAIDASEVQKDAAKIIDENKGYYEAHKELKPKQAWAILEDLSKSKQASWSELHQLRSDLMDFYRNNPDVIKGRGESWIQRMVSTIDNAMANASGGMAPEDLATFRRANDVWEGLKQTYDSPQSPLYHAIRGQFPSQIPGMLTKSPELARQVRATLGSLDGPFQRQFVENILNHKDGATLDLKNLNTKLSRVPDDVLVSMLGGEGAKQLRLLGKVSQKVMSDLNPSGTAKAGVAAGEVVHAATNPIGGAVELGGNFVAGRMMNSAALTDYLTMKPTDLAKMSPKRLGQIRRGNTAAAISSGASARKRQ